MIRQKRSWNRWNVLCHRSFWSQRKQWSVSLLTPSWGDAWHVVLNPVRSCQPRWQMTSKNWHYLENIQEEVSLILKMVKETRCEFYLVSSQILPVHPVQRVTANLRVRWLNYVWLQQFQGLSILSSGSLLHCHDLDTQRGQIIINVIDNTCSRPTRTSQISAVWKGPMQTLQGHMFTAVTVVTVIYLLIPEDMFLTAIKKN